MSCFFEEGDAGPEETPEEREDREFDPGDIESDGSPEEDQALSDYEDSVGHEDPEPEEEP